MDSLYWHDYETFGTRPRADRVCQFAGQRTDEDLNPIGEPTTLFCRQADDYLPDPEACLVTGITPQQANREGLAEPEFVARVHAELARSGTCGVGYNNIRFDDEFTRTLLYRNFYDPYQREYRNGNSRWDIIDVVRLCYALRPAGINWPQHPSGRPSFKLGDLASANQVAHEQAHDALSDVWATIGLARLVRENQPRLYAYCFNNRNKRKVAAQLDFARCEPVLHASSMFSSERGCLAMVAPLCQHPSNNNGIIVFDLSADPIDLLECEAEDIRDRLFTPRNDLPEGIQRIPLKTIHINKAPVITPINVLEGADTKRIKMDVEACLAHLEQIRRQPGLASKVRQVFDTPRDGQDLDPDQAIYSGGFLSQADRSLLAPIRASSADDLQAFEPQLKDPRYRELLFRYRARHHPASLDAQELEVWRAFRTHQLLESGSEGQSRLDQVLSSIRALREDSKKPEENTVLDQLESYSLELVSDLQ
jgi:exodeoxyribonuclease-1